MACPICQYDQYWPVAPAHDAQADAVHAGHGDTAPPDWRLCKRCGNAYPSHPPNRRALQDLWARNRTDEHIADAAARERLRAYRRSIAVIGAERSFRLFTPYASRAPGSILDIGCGLGETVRLFASRGWDAEGVDADPSTASVHREVGIKVKIGQFEDITFDRHYDIIQIAHAIYFITNPMQFLRKVRKRLAPGGLFCVVLADFLAASDPGRPSYAHTFYPTGRSMEYALLLAGFETIMTKKLSGSIYIAARRAIVARPPHVWPRIILQLYRTKELRYALIGRPYLALRRTVKNFLAWSYWLFDRWHSS
jgi:SAM-dependent methyltransferase